MASKMLANELWVVRKFNLEIFCLNVYGDNDETMNYSEDTQTMNLVTIECRLVLLTRAFNVFTLTKCYIHVTLYIISRAFIP